MKKLGSELRSRSFPSLLGISSSFDYYKDNPLRRVLKVVLRSASLVMHRIHPLATAVDRRRAMIEHLGVEAVLVDDKILLSTVSVILGGKGAA